MQKISEDTSQGKDRSTTESTIGGQTYIGLTGNNFTDNEQADYGLLEMILSSTNLNKAYKLNQCENIFADIHTCSILQLSAK